MMWVVRRNADGTYTANDGDRDRAVIERTKHYWLVRRIESNGQISGGDTFHSFAAAKEFCVNNPGVWGK